MKRVIKLTDSAYASGLSNGHIIKVHPKYLFSLIGFGLGSLISLIIIAAEEFDGDVSFTMGHSKIHHLAIPVLFGILGVIIGYIYGKKLHTKEEAFQELFANQQTMSLILNHLPVLISYIDSDLRYLYTNKTYEKWMGLSMNDVYGKHVKDIVVKETYDELQQNIFRVWKGETVRFYSSHEINGSEKFLHVTLIPHLDENSSVKGFFSLVSDVTQLRKRENKIRKQKEKLEELNATKDKFFSIIAHDLKNPFNSLLGIAELLHDDFDTLDEKTKKEFAGHIYEGTQNTYKLLENLLAWSAAQSGKIEFHPSLVNINALIVENLKLLEQLARAKNIQLQSDLKKDYLINTDHDLVSTIIRNLLSNAIKFTPKDGHISIVISATKSIEYLEISVKDTGLGIAPEALRNLFNIGNSYSTSGTEGESGTGLGLILCKEFVEKCGGIIWAESEVGNGSVFHFTLPKSQQLDGNIFA
ncbi:MAG: PAS/PAC sensor signal transduction histidine kinase [uncultured bacterium]|nr:MAG: PAS/PAC sensor signal transduction histidine kinase [uncultured bacterium]HBY02546.1 hypothetical protein [Rikenellaceae bacterium]